MSQDSSKSREMDFGDTYMNDEDVIDGYYSAEVLDEAFGNRPATTTLMDSIFLPSVRVPRDLLNKIASDKKSLEQQLLAQKPLLSMTQEKPYWKKGGNRRTFDSVNLSVYSAVCLADDRHLLEGIISVGGMYADLSGLSLRQAIELSQTNISLEYMPIQYLNMLDQKIFSGIYDYFLIDFYSIFDFLNQKVQKRNKQTLLNRLTRLSQMLLVLDYQLKGKSLPKYHTRMKLVDSNFIPLLCPDSVKNKRSIIEGSMTHLIVGVHKTFTASLQHEGAISRRRFLKVYPQLKGKHSVTDFCKYIDSHRREYVHGMYLHDLVRDYYENKVRVSQQHSSRYIKDTIKEVLEKRDVLEKDFNILLVEQKRIDGGVDIMLIHNRDKSNS